MTDDESIDPSELDTHTLKQIKRVVEAYPVVLEDPSQINDYRAGKHAAYTTLDAHPLLNDRKPKPISSLAVTPFCEAGRNHARQKLRESRIHYGPQHSYIILTCQFHERLHDALAGNHLNLTCHSILLLM